MSLANVNKALEFVNSQKTRTQKIYNGNPLKGSKLPDIIQQFQNVADILEELSENSLQAVESTQKSGSLTIQQRQLFISPSEFDSLPKAMQDALGLSESDRAEMRIIRAIENLEGICSLDVLMVQLFKLYGEINDRRQIQTKLFRMMKKGLIFGVPKRKAVYSLKPIDESILSGEYFEDDQENNAEG